MSKHRKDIPFYFLLLILTLGLSGPYWFISICRTINDYGKKENKTDKISMIIFKISYGLFFALIIYFLTVILLQVSGGKPNPTAVVTYFVIGAITYTLTALTMGLSYLVLLNSHCKKLEKVCDQYEIQSTPGVLNCIILTILLMLVLPYLQSFINEIEALKARHISSPG